jgi:PAS domain S-box-containing protein
MLIDTRLVVVDDEIAQLNAICSLLEDQGFTVTGIPNPLDALEYLKTNRCDLLLSDLKLPEISGIELISKATDLDPQLCAILMTGHGSLNTAIEALQIGVQDYVLKPFKLSTILPVINKALRFRKLKLENEALLKKVTQSNHQLSELNSELDSFAGRVAHDLNSVIHLINGYASSLTSRTKSNLSEIEHRYLQRIQETSSRGAQLVADLLSFARLGTGEIKRTAVDLNELASRAKVISELEYDGPRPSWNIVDLPTVQGDQGLLERVFINLFSNALKFSRKAESPYIEVDTTESHDHFQIHVKDNGVGFDPDMSNSLFKPFQRLHGNHDFEGHGMGLANVKKIMDRHHGTIKASSIPGKGATFVLSFPKNISSIGTPDSKNLENSPEKTEAFNGLKAELQRMSSLMGQFGGWSIEFTPEPRVVWTEEVYAIVEFDRPGDMPPSLEEVIERYIGEHRTTISDAVMRCKDTGEPFEVEVEFLTYKNRTIWLKVRAEAVRNRLGETVRLQGFIQNISEQKKVLSTADRINSLLQAQSQVNVAIPNLTSTDQMFEEACKQAAGIGKIPLVWIVKFAESQEGLRVVGKAGVHQELVDEVMQSISPALQQQMLAYISNNQIYVCNDVRDDPYSKDWQDNAIEKGLESFAVMPLHLRGTLHAAMIYFGNGTKYFDPPMIELLQTVAKNRSLALENLVHGLEKIQTLERLQLLETCVDRLHDMVLITDAESASSNGPRILYANRAYYERTGYCPEEVIGKTPAILNGPQTSKETLERIRTALAQKQAIREELLNYTKQGESFWIEIDVVPITDNQGNHTHWVSIQRDISDRKISEGIQEEHLNRFRSLANATSDCIWDWDLLSNNHIWWSDGLVKIFGFKPEDIEQSIVSWTSRIHPDDLVRVTESVEKTLMSANNNWSDEYRFARADGTWADVVDRGYVIRDEKGKATRMIGGITDVSHLVQVTRQSESQLLKMNLLNEVTRAIVKRLDIDSIYAVVVQALEKDLPSDFSFMGTYHADKQLVSIHTLSETSKGIAAAIDVGNFSEFQIAGTHLAQACTGEFVYQSEMSASPCPIAREIQSRLHLNSLVIVPLTRGDVVLGVMVTARKEAKGFLDYELDFLKQLGEHVSLALGQASLLKDLQSAHSELTQTQEMILQQERLRALAEMAGGIAHDINNAISPATLYVESVLITESQLSEKARKQLETVQLAIDDVAKTVERMGRFAKGKKLTEGVFSTNVNEVCVQVKELTKARWNAMALKSGVSISFETSLDPKIPSINVSESEIREALINLVLNSIDALPNGGMINVVTQLEERDESNQLRILVSDNGLGMTEEARTRCMEPFYSTKGERGTGLGLSMVYGITKRLNGLISIESTLGKGTTVTLSLPVSKINIEASADIDKISPLQINNARRVLIVDDDAWVLESLSLSLREAGHEITTANNGNDAIQLLLNRTRQNDRFDLIITDLGMPDMNGGELAQRVKSISKDTPVILLTGWAAQLDTEKNSMPWVDVVLGKPPRRRELLEIIQKL